MPFLISLSVALNNCDVDCQSGTSELILEPIIFFFSYLVRNQIHLSPELFQFWGTEGRGTVECIKFGKAELGRGNIGSFSLKWWEPWSLFWARRAEKCLVDIKPDDAPANLRVRMLDRCIWFLFRCHTPNHRILCMGDVVSSFLRRLGGV